MAAATAARRAVGYGGRTVIRLRRPSSEQLAELLARLRAAPLTAPGVPADGDPPPGYACERRRVRLGQGADRFAEAAAAVRGWQLHRRAGLTVAASAPRADPGVEVVLGVRVGPVWALAPCRVVWSLDQPGRAGFAYGTLPGHPERGQEAFVVERDDAGAVWLAVSAVSRPADWSTRLLAPLARRWQRRITDAYLRAL